MIYPKNPYCPFDKDYMCPGHGNNGNNNNSNNKPENGTGGNMGGTGNVNPGPGNNNIGGGNNNIGNGNMGNGNMGNGNMGNGNIGGGNMGNGNMDNGNMGNDCMWPGTGNGSNTGTGNMNRNELMQYISELEFALTDLKLYLDTHPDNAQALEMFTKLAATLKSLKSDYARRFAPITAMDVRNQTPFEWVSPEHKWPWQV